ncbi:DUF1236 domain-containing protein [Mangrovibrevibacter kandeliae]|nr:DUF1236 domain-containing protein [Aurantimonas sp. CSK15Z-1]
MVAALVTAFPVWAQTPGKNAADGDVRVFDYALSHPVDNARLTFLPSIGESVPKSIDLHPFEGNSDYAYFYYAGQPVIVHLKTRSVVRVGH